MDSETVTKVAVCISLVTLVISCASLVVTLTGDDGDGTAYTLYFGLDPDATEAEMASLHDSVTEAITSAGIGYTLHWAEGGYATDSGVVSGEHTLVVSITFADDSFIRSLVEDVKAEFEFESVLVERISGQIELM